MSLIDFNQEAKDHGCLHIVVTPLGEASSALFQTVLKQLLLLPPVQLTEPKGTVLFVKFIDSLELPGWAFEGPKWNDFTAHKQILGVLGISQCLDMDDLDNVMAGFKAYCAKFKGTLCDSRCIIYGSSDELSQQLDTRKGYYLIHLNSELETYTSGDVSVDKVQDIVTDFTHAIYITLKSKIIQMEKMLATSFGRSEALKILKSPVEVRDSGHADDDTVIDQRPLTYQGIRARMEKHLADMNLLTGNLHRAFSCYENALGNMKTNNLWSAASNEGLAATAVIMKLCEEVLGQKAYSLPTTLNLLKRTKNPHNSSAPIQSQGSQTLDSLKRGFPSKNDPAINRSATMKKLSSKDQNQSLLSEGGEGLSDRPNGGLVMRRTGSQGQQDSLSNYIESDDEESYEGEGISDNVDGEDDDVDFDDEQGIQVDKRLLQKDYIVDKYSVALRFYTKARLHGAVPHLEALLKFSKYLIQQKRFAMASETLHRMIKIDDPSFITDADKLKLYCAMANVYLTMGFHRKAAMLTHYAARFAASIAKSPEQIQNAHLLISNCLPGYRLSQTVTGLNQIHTGLAVKKNKSSCDGWPVLQAHVLKDFVFLSRRRGEDILAIRHSCYLLQNLCDHLSTSELLNVTSMLEDIVAEASEKACNNSSYATTMIGNLESPLPLLNFPRVSTVKINPLVTQLAPVKIDGFVSSDPVAVKMGPFIFSPFEAKRKKGKQRPEVLWVVGNPGEILIVIENPLSFDMRVSKMTVLLEGSQAEMYPTSLTLPARSYPQDIKLLTVPSEPGFLDVQGYEATVFGIRHVCKVKMHDNRVVRVVPPLPEMRLRLFPVFTAKVKPTSPNREGSFVRTDARRSSKTTVLQLDLLDGETFKYEFEVECLKKVDVEKIILTVGNYDKDFCQFSWENKAIESLLPLSKGCRGSFIVTAVAKIPSWYRVLNDHTQGISKTTVFPSSRNSFGEFVCQSPSGSNTPNSSPTASPTLKQPKAQQDKFGSLQRSSVKSVHETDSVLMDSLNLDQPGAWNHQHSTNTSPNLTRSPGHQRNKSTGNSVRRKFKRKTSKGTEDDDLFTLDNKRASMVSTRSDPGDRDEEARPSKKRISRSSLESKPVSVPQTVESQMQDPLSTSPYPNTTQSSVPQTQSGLLMGMVSSDLSRTSSGNKGQIARKQNSSLTKGHISVPFGPLIREKPQPPSRTKIEGEFRLQYTGGGGFLEGYCREALARVPVVVKPCLIFEQFDVLSAKDSQHLFIFKFSVHNISKRKIEVSFSVDQDFNRHQEEVPSLALDPNGHKDARLSLRRFVLLDSASAHNTNDGEVAKLYAKKVSDVIKIHWKSMDDNKVGVVSLDDLHLPILNISLMRPIPLLFGVSMDGCALPTQISYVQKLDLGVEVKLSVTMTNNSGLCMLSSFLLFEPYFQKQNVMERSLNRMLLHSGNLVISIPQLNPDESYQHNITLVFLCKGSFRLEIKSYTHVGTESANKTKVDNSSNSGNPSSNRNPPSTTVNQSSSSECSKPDKQNSGTCTKKLELSSPAKGPSETETNVTTRLESNQSVKSQHTLTEKSSSEPSITSMSGEPRFDQNGCVSPPAPLSEPTSPRQFSSSGKSVISPGGSSRNKALLLAKKYEQEIATRATLIYKEDSISSSAVSKRRGSENTLIARNVTSLGDKASKEVKVSLSDSEKSPNQIETSQIDELNNLSPITESTSTKSTKTILSSLQRDVMLKERLDNINSFLSVSAVMKPVTISPPLASSTCVKNSLPSPSGNECTSNHHNTKIATPGGLQVSTRFQKLMSLRSHSPKSVRLISGPQFKFNVT